MPVYQGQFRVVQPEVVLADIAAQVAAGARHITFGDPDFFNGPTHAMHIVEALHAAHPRVSYDVTIKVEHLLQHRDLLPRLAASRLRVRHERRRIARRSRAGAFSTRGTRAPISSRSVDLCRAAGLTLVPTFVAFHPWLTLEDYCDLLDTLAGLDLVDHVAPIQLAIRLLVPDGSRLLELPELRTHLGAFDPATLSYPWAHADPRVDALHAASPRSSAPRLTADRRAVFDEIRALACERAGLADSRSPLARGSSAVPYLNEPWYCCAEPNAVTM